MELLVEPAGITHVGPVVPPPPQGRLLRVAVEAGLVRVNTQVLLKTKFQ